MNKNYLFLSMLIIFIVGITMNSAYANDAYDIEHDNNFNNEMEKLGLKFDGNSGIGDRQNMPL